MIIEEVEMINGRNSRNRKCTPYNDIVSFDEMVKEKHIRSNGCTAPYFQPVAGVPRCNTKDKIKRSVYDYDTVRAQDYLPCCKRISRMTVKHTGAMTHDGIFHLGFRYPQHAKLISQTKDVDIHALIGNIGGYVGLFLGM